MRAFCWFLVGLSTLFLGACSISSGHDVADTQDQKQLIWPDVDHQPEMVGTKELEPEDLHQETGPDAAGPDGGGWQHDDLTWPEVPVAGDDAGELEPADSVVDQGVAADAADLPDLQPIDTDGDGYVDGEDNCPQTVNPLQADMDADGIGDLCDLDADGDNAQDDVDNCLWTYNPFQADSDADGLGDLCDPDGDNDGLDNADDNCPFDANDDQQDFDDDGLGDACDGDDDDDGVPDDTDEAPLDASWPGLALEGAIYAHTSSTLYTWNSQTLAVELIGAFGWPANVGSDSMTDVAIDYDGKLFGVSFNRVFRCSAVSAECIFLANLPTSFNGLTVVPEGTVEPNTEVLIGIGNNGSWNRIDVVNNQAAVTQLGSYGSGYTSSGDAYSIEGLGTFASVNKSGAFGGNMLVKVDPVTGVVLEEIGVMQGYSSVYGLASDGENAYAFDASGTIVKLDVSNGQVTVALPSNQGQSWWGAGVTTRNFGL